MIWYAWVDYNGQTGLLEVRLSQDATRPQTPLLSHSLLDSPGILLPDILGTTEAFVGFTAATGMAAANHDVRTWKLPAGTMVGKTVTVNNVAPTVDPGTDATIDEGSLFSGSGSFVDPDDATDPPGAEATDQLPLMIVESPQRAATLASTNIRPG